MLNTVIIGASGYTGAELSKMVSRHPQLILSGLYVSANSLDAGKPLSDLHGQLKGIVDLPLLPLTDIKTTAAAADIVLLATAHEVSHDIATTFLDAGCQVFDLSGAFRVKADDFYQQYYGFEHQHSEWLDNAAYGLAEWNDDAIRQAQLIAVPGCYPTASQLALKPLVVADLLDRQQWPVINAVSGVSGAGRKATMTNSFCEVSLHAYGLFTHRHQPEISHHLNCDVIFTPHLGNFKRGILATITAKLASGVTADDVTAVLESAYLKTSDQHAVRLLGNKTAQLDDVVGSCFCDIGWQVQGEHIILTAAIDNLLKGAASQAMQCINIRNGFSQLTALV
ncbi:N-acetyl-gamma-glutamyl-phosphate reductase [Photobacterium kishitanii]|uniref:N-acetyl-gamma-glutamyl-phosphate reductase n=1 Tax=Photobacterium kishitanii TaxID=318456 RepID=A0AAX0YV56_9GAMM|nr:N-acetyl-gamma-glutamyl-phosphate reductase [Photobacterium kishitanii]KJG58071.1 N-acetyl-gamma-glutamyl-phosphate reductase [Photobacterium kishitanii]KJG61588.1 N-acetyl-gamma-glutamyl-phosphate reductase [Photobacterium kishitanii]KJG65886.1 N-acetyl-gamma-glutamyl-phosphate reductase [Photobacterium kishitanii]KJG69737.1 N-acetyl-gamma-glutamyl-phosphate reductase [Photobacterium kishitanii]PSX18741.1 N-acetyl-gamma-glutamyl-phosphate reductase [Photobacterium kishitanii]